MDLSVIIVTYNSRNYVAFLLKSLLKATQDLSVEIIVVDNHSSDGTDLYIREHFPKVKLISLEKNLGFSRANNMGIGEAKGKYLAFINPDIIVTESTLKKLIGILETRDDIAGIGPMLLNPDGTFARDSRHSIPDPVISLWKVLGLQSLFPKSKIFGKYNLTYLDPDFSSIVPAISGSFMVFRGTAIHQVGGFDNDFFLYCEDIDLCHKMNRNGQKIWYEHSAIALHFKGESIQDNHLAYIKNFHKSMRLFYQKHFRQSAWKKIEFLIQTGIYLRSFLVLSTKFYAEWKVELLFLFMMITSGLLDGMIFIYQSMIGLLLIILNLWFKKALSSVFASEIRILSWLTILLVSLGSVAFLPLGIVQMVPFTIASIIYFVFLQIGTRNTSAKKLLQVKEVCLITDNAELTEEEKQFLMDAGFLVLDIFASGDQVNSYYKSGRMAYLLDIRLPFEWQLEFLQKHAGHSFYFYDREETIIISDGFSIGKDGVSKSPELLITYWKKVIMKWTLYAKYAICMVLFRRRYGKFTAYKWYDFPAVQRELERYIKEYYSCGLTDKKRRYLKLVLLIKRISLIQG